jgi:L-amino acid N-acyltransferase YncA
MIVPMQLDHEIEVLQVYEQGLVTGQATFNTKVPSWEEWDKAHHTHSRFVALEKGKVIGWVAISPVSTRYCYRGMAEFSIYIRNGYKGKGVGGLLMQELIKSSEVNEIWTLQSSTFPENISSIALQKKYGLEK